MEENEVTGSFVAPYQQDSFVTEKRKIKGSPPKTMRNSEVVRLWRRRYKMIVSHGDRKGLRPITMRWLAKHFGVSQARIYQIISKYR